MKAQRPIIADDDHQVIPFRRRSASGAMPGTCSYHSADNPPRHDPDGESDDFRHRMWANLAAFAFTAILTAVGIWLASSLADLRTSQDCLLIGRRDCAHFVMPRG